MQPRRYMTRYSLLAGALALMLVATTVVANDTHVSASSDQASRAFDDANARMHDGMAMAKSGDVDLDFARGMLAHHRGAVEMAQIELEHGSDPEMRALAREVIHAQQQEIEQLSRWIHEHEKRASHDH